MHVYKYVQSQIITLHQHVWFYKFVQLLVYSLYCLFYDTHKMVTRATESC